MAASSGWSDDMAMVAPKALPQAGAQTEEAMLMADAFAKGARVEVATGQYAGECGAIVRCRMQYQVELDCGQSTGWIEDIIASSTPVGEPHPGLLLTDQDVKIEAGVVAVTAKGDATTTNMEDKAENVVVSAAEQDAEGWRFLVICEHLRHACMSFNGETQEELQARITRMEAPAQFLEQQIGKLRDKLASVAGRTKGGARSWTPAT